MVIVISLYTPKHIYVYHVLVNGGQDGEGKEQMKISLKLEPTSWNTASFDLKS